MVSVEHTLDPDLQYQCDYTSNPVAQKHMYDVTEREGKADKILCVLKEHLGSLSNVSVLDASSSTGVMSNRFCTECGEVTGIDIDGEAVSHASRMFSASNLTFRRMDALHTQFAAESFDVVVSNQMYEHVPDPAMMLNEFYRILKPGGVVYFGAVNRLKVIETHYGRIPFLSWWPRPVSNVILRMLRRAPMYYERPMTLWGLRRLVSEFEVIDYTLKVLQDPERFHAEDVVHAGTLKHRWGMRAVKAAYWLSPGYIWLLKKPAG